MPKKRGGLGKGLNALIPDAYEDMPARKGVMEIEINSIRTNPDQPRKHFDETKIETLKASIQEYGIMQPILVKKMDKGYQIIAGERRYRAARKAGLKQIPCLVRETEAEEGMALALIENLQREDLNDIEEASAYRQLMEGHGFTQEKVAEVAGKSRPYVANMVRLLGLEPEVQDLVAGGLLSGGHGRTLLGLPPGKTREVMAERIMKNGWSVRETERQVKAMTTEPVRKGENKQEDPEIRALEEFLRNRFATKIRILNRSRNRGKIEIEYHGLEEFERILSMLKD